MPNKNKKKGNKSSPSNKDQQPPSKDASKVDDAPPPYSKRIGVIWEGTDKVSDLPPIRGHTGVFAIHMDDCLCAMGGWPCFRDGTIWSCCGSTDEKSYCSKAQK